VTATVESLPLITGSILSKKLAEGLDALVLDVKTGTGAFMAGIDEARELAASLLRVAHGAGLAASALITNMDQVLGRTVGNALEVVESIEFLTNAGGERRLAEVTLTLAAEALVLAGLAPDVTAARAMAQARLDDGAAAERFARMVAALGGPSDLLEQRRLPQAPCVVAIHPATPGVVSWIDGRAIGIAVIELGGGRTDAGQSIDVRVGLSEFAGLGEHVDGEHPICLVHATDQAAVTRAAERIHRAVRIGDVAPLTPPPVHERLA
jgi:thymidine phosphorylase